MLRKIADICSLTISNSKYQCLILFLTNFIKMYFTNFHGNLFNLFSANEDFCI